MAMTTIAYKDGAGTSKTALAGSNGTDTSTGVTLCDASGVNITTLPVSVASLPALTTGAAVIGAVTQSGTWTVATNADGTIGAGTAPSKAQTSGLIYNSSPITLTTTQGSALQGDVNGYLKVSVPTLPALTTGAAVIGAVTQSGTWTAATNADGTIGAGTAPSKSLVGGLVYNSSPITLTTTQGAALQGDANGYLKVSIPALPALTTGAAVIGAVTQSGTWNVGTVTTLPALVAGSATIGGVKLIDTAGTNVASISAANALKVDGSAVTQPVSVATLPALTTGAAVIGAVTQSGTWTAATNADGTIAAGTAPAKALVGGLVYNSSPITLTTGQASAIQADANGYLKVSLAASPAVQTVGGTTVVIVGTLTRPANTTIYVVGQQVADNAATAISFSSATRIAAGSGTILGARLIKTSTVTTSATFRLWLHNATPGTTTDHVAFGMTNALRDARIGYIDFAAPLAGTDCVECQGVLSQALPIGFKLASGSTLYGVLVAQATYTPTSAEVFDVNLQIAQD